MKEKFYATLKLVSGEELITEMKTLDGEYDGYFILYSPIQVSEVSIPGIISSLKIDRWMKLSNQNVFLLHRDKIITLSEADNAVKLFYRMSLDKIKIEETEHVEASKAIQDIISIEEMRTKLEELYNNY